MFNLAIPPMDLRSQGQAGLPSIRTVLAQCFQQAGHDLASSVPTIIAAPSSDAPPNDLFLLPIDQRRQGPCTLPPIRDAIPEFAQTAPVGSHTVHIVSEDSSSSTLSPMGFRNGYETVEHVVLSPLNICLGAVSGRDVGHSRSARCNNTWWHLATRLPTRSTTVVSSQSNTTLTGSSPRSSDLSPNSASSRNISPVLLDAAALLNYLRREPEMGGNYYASDADEDEETHEEQLKSLRRLWMGDERSEGLAEASTAIEEAIQVVVKKGQGIYGMAPGRREEQGTAIEIVHSPRPTKMLRLAVSHLEAKAGLYLLPPANSKVERAFNDENANSVASRKGTLGVKVKVLEESTNVNITVSAPVQNEENHMNELPFAHDTDTDAHSSESY